MVGSLGHDSKRFLFPAVLKKTFQCCGLNPTCTLKAVLLIHVFTHEKYIYIVKISVIFYKTLFGKEPSGEVKLGGVFWEADELVTDEENGILEAPFSEEEVRDAVFSSYAKGAPGPYGFSFLFYQTFWDIVKSDFMNLVRSFEKGD